MECWGDAFKWDSTNPLSIHPKLTKEHIHLTQVSTMRNHLAEEFLDENMFHLFEFKAVLGEKHERLNGVIDILKQTSKLIAHFRDMRPISNY